MKKLLFLPILTVLLSLHGCSWICRFYIANTSSETISIEIKLMDSPGSFPIFHYPKNYYGKLHSYALKQNNQIDFETSKEVKADTLEKYSHYKFEIPPYTAIEIGQLQNDNYEKHDQYFINGRVFNIEKISISQRKIDIVPSTFDNYFKKGKYKEVYFVI